MVVVDHAMESRMTQTERIKIEYLKAYASRSQNLMIQAGWVYTLVIDGKEVNREVSHVNWDPRYQPFGRPGIDFVQGGHVYKEAVFIIKKPKLSECYLPSKEKLDDNWTYRLINAKAMIEVLNAESNSWTIDDRGSIKLQGR